MARWFDWYNSQLIPATSQLQLLLKNTEPVKGFPNFPPEFFVLSHALFKKAYIAWNQVTAVDFLFFPSVHQFIVRPTRCLFTLTEVRHLRHRPMGNWYQAFPISPCLVRQNAKSSSPNRLPQLSAFQRSIAFLRHCSTFASRFP